jgi:hypothetical protein
MEIKLFEIRDRMTFIPCFGILMAPSEAKAAPPCGHGAALWSQGLAETFLLRRAGFSFDAPLVLFGRLEGGECQYDPYDWRGDTRTMRFAHRYIQANWPKLRSGDVIDIEFILGETKTSKESERG